MCAIGSINDFGYYPNYNYRSNIAFKQNNIDINTKKEIEDLKKSHSITKQLLLGVTGLSALVIGILLYKNHNIGKQAKANLDAVKNKLTHLKENMKNQNPTNGTKVDAIDFIDVALDVIALAH